MRVLHVAEKPSVARELVKHLGPDTGAAPAASGGRGMQSWRFPFANFLNTPVCEFTVTAVRGHLMEIDFDAAFKSWTGTSPADLFHAAIQQRVNPSMTELERGLTNFARLSNALVLWLDCDREGEAIAFEVLEVCRRANPALRIFRATFSALTQADIRRAVSQLIAPNRNLSEAVLARSEIDLRVGAAFTRFLSLRYRSRVSSTTAPIVSYGPCQFPTLGLVVARWERVVAFVSEPFWSLALSLSIAGPVALQWARDRVFDELVVKVLYASLARWLLDSSDGLVRVASVTERATSKWRPLPLNTVELCKLASTKLHLASHRTMQLAETLYTKGLISYPRTETDKYHETMDLRALVELHRGHSVWGGFVTRLLLLLPANQNGGGLRFTSPRVGNKDDKAHPPIHPCKAAEPNRDFTDPDEARLYDLIARHFLGQCSPDAKGLLTRLEVELKDERFATEGLKITELNYLEIFTYDRWSGSALDIPAAWREGTLVPVDDFKISQGQTTPPSLLSEAELIALMDSHGIGTDATMHEHIRTVQDRNYVARTHDSKFQPTSLGLALIRGFSAYSVATSLAQPTLRATMEADIAAIADGRITRTAFLNKYVTDLRAIFLAISDNPAPLDNHLHAVPAPPPPPPPSGGAPPAGPPSGGRSRGGSAARGARSGGSFRGRGAFSRGGRAGRGARSRGFTRVRRT